LRLVVAVLALALVAAALGGFASPAHAGLLSCGTGTQVFAPWGDYSSYYAAPNGGLEAGSTGWTLTGGASVTAGNEPFYASGFHSLSLPSGSTATSPRTCIGTLNNFVRMFASDAGGTDGGLHVRVIWYGLLSNVLGVTDFTTFAPGGQWAPTTKLTSLGGIVPLVPLLGTTSARIQLTPIGDGSNWQVDDVYVDPLCWR
jgi:hypothetical protein